MSTKTKAKQFEKEVQSQLEKLRNVAVIRLYDVTMGYTGIDNPCDFIVYTKPKMIMLECKAIGGHLMNFNSHIRDNQWNKLLSYSKINGIEAGILVWFYNYNKTYYINIEDLEIMKCNGKKSFNCKFDIPTIIVDGKRRKVFYDYYMEKFIKELING